MQNGQADHLLVLHRCRSTDGSREQTTRRPERGAARPILPSRRRVRRARRNPADAGLADAQRSGQQPGQVGGTSADGGSQRPGAVGRTRPAGISTVGCPSAQPEVLRTTLQRLPRCRRRRCGSHSRGNSRETAGNGGNSRRTHCGPDQEVSPRQGQILEGGVTSPTGAGPRRGRPHRLTAQSGHHRAVRGGRVRSPQAQARRPRRLPMAGRH